MIDPGNETRISIRHWASPELKAQYTTPRDAPTWPYSGDPMWIGVKAGDVKTVTAGGHVMTIECLAAKSDFESGLLSVDLKIVRGLASDAVQSGILEGIG
jgi:hypothetical protein